MTNLILKFVINVCLSGVEDLLACQSEALEDYFK